MTTSTLSVATLFATALLVTGCGGSAPGRSNAAAPASSRRPPLRRRPPRRPPFTKSPRSIDRRAISQFLAAFNLNQTPDAVQPELRHGVVAATADWPASLYATFSTPDGTAACTAALVGPEAMLTAAHCVPVSGQVTFKYKDQPEP